ncbi:hypothetical protein COOONC_12397 [Cooperia oncophora]
MNKQAQDNMLSVIQKFLSNAPPSCDVEISVKYNLSKDNTQLPKTSTIRMNTAAANENTRPFTEPRRIGSATFMPRKLRSEERMALKDAIPILTPEKKTASFKPIRPHRHCKRCNLEQKFQMREKRVQERV